MFAAQMTVKGLDPPHSTPTILLYVFALLTEKVREILGEKLKHRVIPSLNAQASGQHTPFLLVGRSSLYFCMEASFALAYLSPVLWEDRSMQQM